MPPEKKRKATPAWKKVLGGIFYLFVCLVALALGTGAQWAGRSQTILDTIDLFVRQEPPEETFLSDTLTLLILGCDEDRYYHGPVTRAYARSDMMLVARIDFKNNRVGAVSIPRDLEVQLPGYRAQKINAYHSIGGKELAEAAAEQVLGIPIDRTLVLNYEAFQKMVDTAGGVEIFVPKKMDYDDNAGQLHVHLKPGRQKLNGYEAMGFVRFRHDALSDYARQDRQKDFLMAFKETVKANPLAFPEVLNQAGEVLGGGLSSREMSALGLFLRGVANDNIKMGQVPTNPGRGSNLDLDSGKLYEVLAQNYIIDAPLTAATTEQGR